MNDGISFSIITHGNQKLMKEGIAIWERTMI